MTRNVQITRQLTFSKFWQSRPNHWSQTTPHVITKLRNSSGSTFSSSSLAKYLTTCPVPQTTPLQTHHSSQLHPQHTFSPLQTRLQSSIDWLPVSISPPQNHKLEKQAHSRHNAPPIRCAPGDRTTCCCREEGIELGPGTEESCACD